MHSPSILIVDDVAEIVEELTTMLNLLDMPALGAGTLARAIELLEREPSIRLVACDVQLNGESGIDILDRIGANPALAGRGLAFLFMTGDAMRFDDGSGIAGHPVLMKPVQPAELVRSLERLLERGDKKP